MTLLQIAEELVRLLNKEPEGYEIELLQQFVKWFNDNNPTYFVHQIDTFKWKWSIND